jgi:YVTN family beta-propeller protein
MRRALLVATYEYEDAGLRRLAAPERDVEALADVLEDQAVAGFDVQVVINRPTHEVGRAIADFFADGDITTDELYDYTYKAVTAEQPNQRPRQFAEVEGRTVVASNARWALPEQLASAINSPLAEIRQTALAPLGQLLQANNELVRRTAHEQLERLRDDDSRSVAAAAQAYLDNPPPPLRHQPAAAPTVRRTTGPTFKAAARATARRWHGRVRLPQQDWPILGLTIVAAAAQIVCAVVATPRIWQVIVMAVLAVAAVAAVIKLRRNAAAFAAGLAVPALLGSVQAAGWILHEFSRSLNPLPASWYLGASVAWLAAGVVGLLRLRRTPPVREAPRRLLIGLGAVAAVLVLVILLYADRHARIHPLWVPVFYILTAEIVIAGPLLQLNRQFLAGWVLSGFVLLLSFQRFQRETDLPQFAAIALLSVWLLLGIATLLRPATGRPLRRWITAAALVAPAVVGVAGIAVVPPAPRSPLAVGLAVSPDDRFLYATDVQNGWLLKFSTTTQERVGEPLEVGEFPSNLIVEPDGSRLYVANTKSNSVSVIDAANWTVVGQPIAVAPEPTEFALNTRTHRLFVLSQKAATITEIDTETLATIRGPLAAGSTPTGVAVDDSGRLYVASTDAGTVAVIDTKSRQAAWSPIDVDLEPIDLLPGPDGALYVVGSASYAVINTKVDVSKPKPETVPGGGVKGGAVSNDGENLYLFGRSGTDDTVRVVDTGSRTVVASLGANLGLPARLAVSPDGTRIYLSRFFEPGIAVLDSSGLKQIGTIDTDN